MLIRKESVITGIVRERNIPINPSDWTLYKMGHVSIDDAMPYLTAEDREFILAGVTPDDWKNAFKEEIDDYTV